MRDHGCIFTFGRYHRQHASGGDTENSAQYRRKPERPPAGIGWFDHELAFDQIKQRPGLSGMPPVTAGKIRRVTAAHPAALSIAARPN